jgi:hypothetical protein
MKKQSKLPSKKIILLYSMTTAWISDQTTNSDPTSLDPLSTTHIFNK